MPDTTPTPSPETEPHLPEGCRGSAPEDHGHDHASVYGRRWSALLGPSGHCNVSVYLDEDRGVQTSIVVFGGMEGAPPDPVEAAVVAYAGLRDAIVSEARVEVPTVADVGRALDWCRRALERGAS